MLDRSPAMTRNPPNQAPGNGPGSARVPRPGPAGPAPGGGRERHPLARPPAPRVRRRDEMDTGLAISAVLHTAAVVLMLLGLPDWFKHEPPEPVAIAVTLVNPSELTRTTKVNPHPKANAKPVEPTPVPAPKPQPPVPDPLTPPPPAPPPPKAEAAPPPKPEPKPEPPKPELPKQEAPPPLPIPKPEPPKPEPVTPPPKPEPPKPQVKPEPPKQAKVEPKKQDDPFDSLLKTLAKPVAPEKSDTPPKPVRQPPQSQVASSLANAPLGSQISTSEKDMIAAAVSQCWDVDAGAKDASSLRAVIQVEIDPDGTVRNTSIVSVEGGGSEAVQRVFAERARRAPLIPACNKLPIPPGKYEQLKVFTFTFSPQGVL